MFIDWMAVVGLICAVGLYLARIAWHYVARTTGERRTIRQCIAEIREERDPK